MVFRINKKYEKIIAAFAYFIGIGDMLYQMQEENSAFVAFHYRQANRLLWILSPGLLCLIGVYVLPQFEETFGLIFVALLLAFILISLVGAVTALLGKKIRLVWGKL